MPPPYLESLLFPIASISSINIIHGAICVARLNKSLTRDAPTPTNISTKSEPESEKKGTCASPATAFARSVFPVPGGPTKSAPLGSFAPIFVYFEGLCRKSTISFMDSFASSCPATSRNVTPVSFCTYIFAVLLPTPITPPPFLVIILNTIPKTIQSPRINIIYVNIPELGFLISLVNSIPAFSSLSTNIRSLLITPV